MIWSFVNQWMRQSSQPNNFIMKKLHYLVNQRLLSMCSPPPNKHFHSNVNDEDRIGASNDFPRSFQTILSQTWQMKILTAR